MPPRVLVLVLVLGVLAMGAASCGTSSDGGTGASGPSGPSGVSGPTGAAGECDPSYKGACLDPSVSDYDCAGGTGDGPKYVDGPIEVTGADPYGLDADGNGVGCE